MRARDIITKQLVILAGYEPSNEDTIASWHLFERDTDAIIAALRAAGFEIVPREATDKMVAAFKNKMEPYTDGSGFNYHAALSAAISAAKEQT